MFGKGQLTNQEYGEFIEHCSLHWNSYDLKDDIIKFIQQHYFSNDFLVSQLLGIIEMQYDDFDYDKDSEERLSELEISHFKGDMPNVDNAAIKWFYSYLNTLSDDGVTLKEILKDIVIEVDDKVSEDHSFSCKQPRSSLEALHAFLVKEKIVSCKPETFIRIFTNKPLSEKDVKAEWLLKVRGKNDNEFLFLLLYYLDPLDLKSRTLTQRQICEKLMSCFSNLSLKGLQDTLSNDKYLLKGELKFQEKNFGDKRFVLINYLKEHFNR